MAEATSDAPKKHLRRNLLLGGLVVGMIGGWLYWKFVGCVSGTCPIWSNMWIATAYGGLLGWLLAGLLPFGAQRKTRDGSGGDPSAPVKEESREGA